MNFLLAVFSSLAALIVVGAYHTSLLDSDSRNVSQAIFDSLEELARIVDIAYCVGSSGIQSPFRCLSRCSDFPGFELVSTWHTGLLLSDSCGYIALSHPPHPRRIVVAFRGTYSIANTVADLSTIPAKYAPFPVDGGSGDDVCATGDGDDNVLEVPKVGSTESVLGSKCQNCTVHLGFLTAWKNTRCIIIPQIDRVHAAYPDYQLTLVGHSLGGAVAALASLEFQSKGWEPHVTTFGEPRIGNRALNSYIDERFNLTNQDSSKHSYRRVTHISDPVPLLPFQKWGFRAHAGEIFISKYDLPPKVSDLEHCEGDEDPECIAESGAFGMKLEAWSEERSMGPLQDRFQVWQRFLAHRDYFWRLGLCIPQWGGWWPPSQSPMAVQEL